MEKVEEEEVEKVEEEVNEVVEEREREARGGIEGGKRESRFADGRRVKKGGSARESERSIRTLATFFVVGTGNSERKREREIETERAVRVCAPNAEGDDERKR